MSTYPFWLLSFDLREDLEPHVLSVLTAVGQGSTPDPADLGRLPPVPRAYLARPRRLQSDQRETVAGTPVRIARSGVGTLPPHLLTLTIEFAQHDDEFANGGWLFWLWVLSLARRPDPDEGRSVLGYHGMYRGDYASTLVYIDAEGVTEDGPMLTFADITAGLADDTDDDFQL